MKEIELPFDFNASDSDLEEYHISIPEGFKAEINEDNVILKNIKSEDDKIKQKIIKLIKMSSEVGGFALHKWEADEMLTWIEKQDNKDIFNIPSREVILAIWDLGNYWKELTKGVISTKHGTQLDYIQKHWCESEHYLREKHKQKPTSKV